MSRERARILLQVCCAIGCCWALSLPTLRAGADDATLAKRVEALLSAGVEPSAADATIVALGEPGELALRSVFEREGAPRFVRLRALGVLASFETESTAHYFQALVQAAAAPTERLGALHPARSPLVLRRALEGLLPTARLLLAASPARPSERSALDVDAVMRCLSHEDPHVRRVAAQLLASLPSEGKSLDAHDPTREQRIDQALGSQLMRERSRMVRSSVEHAITSRSARARAQR